MLEIEKKADLIIESAIRRFTHFGIQKTTMNDVAEELGFTPSSIYYYFPDKNSLIIAVLQRILEQYLVELMTDIQSSTTLSSLLNKVVELRDSFTEKFFMLRLQDPAIRPLFDEACHKEMELCKKGELEIVSTSVETLKANGKVKVNMDIEQSCHLFLDCMTGLTMMLVNQSSSMGALSEDELSLLCKKQKELAAVFCEAYEIK